MSNYTYDEVRALVENYDGLSHRRQRLWLLVRYADLDKAVRRLPRRERDVLVLHGFYGLSQEETAKVLGIHQTSVGRIYVRALPKVVRWINGRERP